MDEVDSTLRVDLAPVKQVLVKPPSNLLLRTSLTLTASPDVLSICTMVQQVISSPQSHWALENIYNSLCQHEAAEL